MTAPALITALLSRKPADRPDAADKLEEHAQAMAMFKARHGNIDPAMYAVAERFRSGELGEHEYIFELGRVYDRTNFATRERIESLVGFGYGRPAVPAERPPREV